jgi:hypothetical protein
VAQCISRCSSLASTHFSNFKKDATIWFISNFCKFNKRIKQKPYLIPKIQDLLLKLKGFQYAMTLDQDITILSCCSLVNVCVL